MGLIIKDQEAKDSETNVQRAKVVGSRCTLECSNVRRGEGAKDIADIAYWKSIEKDRNFKPVLAAIGPTRKYMLYQDRDKKGFHNRRIVLETYLAFAAATGRTLVLPPRGPLEHVNAEFDAFDFYTLDEINAHWHVAVITTQEFFEREVEPGKVGLKPTKSFPAMSESDIFSFYEELHRHQLSVPELVDIGPDDVYVFPYEARSLVNITEPRYAENARLQKEIAGRHVLEYTKRMQQANFLYFPRNLDLQADMPLFYLYFTHAHLWESNFYKRFIRDALRFKSEVFCKASQVISLLQGESRRLGFADGSFHTLHVRRGDFCMYKLLHGACRPASDIYSVIKDWVADGEVLYIATNEIHLSFFDDLRSHYKVYFLESFQRIAALDELSIGMIPMLEPVILSHGKIFTGSWTSTLSAYAVRLRGYMGKPNNTSMYSFQPFARFPEKHYLPDEYLPRSPLFDSEYSIAWEHIDDI